MVSSRKLKGETKPRLTFAKTRLWHALKYWSKKRAETPKMITMDYEEVKIQTKENTKIFFK